MFTFNKLAGCVTLLFDLPAIPSIQYRGCILAANSRHNNWATRPEFNHFLSNDRNDGQRVVLVHGRSVRRNQRQTGSLTFQKRQAETLPPTELHTDITVFVQFTVAVRGEANFDVRRQWR